MLEELALLIVIPTSATEIWQVQDNLLDDVIRFMYEHKISTATLGGHGIGAKLALATGCFHG